MNYSKNNHKHKKSTELFVGNTKKHPRANLENYSKLFVQLGLVLSLIVVYVLIQSKTFSNEIAVLDDTGRIDNYNPEQDIVYEIEPTKKKPVQREVEPEIIKEVDDDTLVDDVIFKDQDPDTPVEEPKFIDVKPEEIIYPDGIPIILVEEAPLFPGCKGTNEERKACFAKKIGKFVNRKFDAGLAEQLGLTSGIQRIHTIFKIDKKGNIVDVQARAPHKSLQQEAIRVINLLPKMEPGKQSGNPVVVKYSLPIAFKIQ